MNPFLEAHNSDAIQKQRQQGRRRMTMDYEDNSGRRWLSERTVIVIIIYMSLLLDNVLLTVIVPILPDFLLNGNGGGNTTSLLYKKYDFEFVSSILGAVSNGSLEDTQQGMPTMEKSHSTTTAEAVAAAAAAATKAAADDENVSIGVLLSMKAFVQLAFNPIIGGATRRVGYRWPILLGTMSLVLSSFIFAIGDNYYSLLFARAVQGIGSSCLGVCGMSLVACLYPEDDKRSKVMGVVLGSIALGVLIGYPVGGILYDFVGKSSPFWIICAALVVAVGLQLQFLGLNSSDFGSGTVVVGDASNRNEEDPKWTELLSDFEINLISLAIFISTSAMSILEPCLPLWLLNNLHPKRWQLGTVFIPDSLGYLIGTNGFGKVAYEMGQIRVAVVALVIIGCSCIVIPGSTSMASLLVPHFGLGLGIGVLDAALVPYLSSRIDYKYSHSGGGGFSDCSSNDLFPSNYGTVYAIQQMAVSLAYSASPLLASEMVKFMGFPMLMFIIGIVNIVYAVLFYYFTVGPGQRLNGLPKDKDHLLALNKLNQRLDTGPYNRFYDSTN